MMIKTRNLRWGIAIIISTLIIGTGFTSFETTPLPNPNPEANLIIPSDIQAIFDQSCFGCHNVDAKSDKSKKKLLLDKMPHLSKAKIVGKLGNISDVLTEGDMPPEKFLEKYPDKALTKEQAKTLKEWADSAAEELMK